MSSGNPSINSPASTANSYLPPFIVDENDQLIDDNGEAIDGLQLEVEANNEDTPLPVRPRLETMGPLRAPPISPTSALSILQAYGEGGSAETARDLARRLASTVVSHSLEFERLQREQTATFQQERDRLVTATGAEVRRLPPVPERAESASRADLPSYQEIQEPATVPLAGRARVGHRPPNGFMHNAGHLPDFLIPEPAQPRGRTRGTIVAPFIRISARDPTFAEGTTNGSLIYAFPLHAAPQEPSRSSDSLPPWLLALLHPTSPHYDLVVQAANRDGDWGLQGELERYHELSRHMHRAQERIDRWRAELEPLQSGRDRCRFRLERARAGTRLQALRHIDDTSYGYFEDEPLAQSARLRRGGARRGGGRPSR